MRNYKLLTDEMINDLFSGMTVSQIAKKNGVSYTSMYKRFERNPKTQNLLGDNPKAKKKKKQINLFTTPLHHKGVKNLIYALLKSAMREKDTRFISEQGYPLMEFYCSIVNIEPELIVKGIIKRSKKYD